MARIGIPRNNAERRRRRHVRVRNHLAGTGGGRDWSCTPF
jgi:hypothetical protein